MLICLKHPKYQGKENPILACKTCCTIFLTELKTQGKAVPRDTAALDKVGK